MQKRVAEAEAADSEPTWYLTRGGEQLGPLTGRELSLFAEGGNFKPGDLVWTAGFDAWKPADDVFSLDPSSAASTESSIAPSQESDAPSSETAEAAVFSLPLSPEDETSSHVALGGDQTLSIAPELDDPAHAVAEPNGEDVDALIQALTGNGEPAEPTLKLRILEEAKKFAGIVVYLWVVFMVLLLHEWIVLSQNHIGFKFYGLAVINAILLGKIMLVAEQLRFAESLKRKPLIYPIVYKAVAFTTLLFMAYVLEAMTSRVAWRAWVLCQPTAPGWRHWRRICLVAYFLCRAAPVLRI